MAAGLEPEMSAAFPLGKAENNYTIQVNVKVMDAYMLSTETFFTVRVSGNLLFYCVVTNLAFVQRRGYWAHKRHVGLSPQWLKAKSVF